MQRVAIADLAASAVGESVDGTGLTDALGTTDVAVNRYQVEPDARISGLHAHLDQEEVFVVVDGVATFETWTPAAEGEAETGTTVAVEAEGAIRFGPGEFQSCTNRSDAPVVVYALGAPRGTEEFRVPIPCLNCDQDAMRPTVVGDREALVCPDCSAESVAACPSCGGGQLTVVLDEADQRPVERCRDCGATAEPQ